MPSPSRRWHWAYLLWLLVPLLLWWALRDIRLAEIWATLQRLSWAQVGLLVLLNVLALFSFTAGWWLILRAQGYAIPYLALVRYRIAAFGVSYFTLGPQFGGEPLQVLFLQKRHGVPGTVAVAATALDKIFELLVNFIFLMLGLLLMAHWQILPGLTDSLVLPLMALLLAFPLLAWLGAWARWTPLTWLMERWPTRRPTYQRVFQAVRESELHIVEFCRTQPASVLGVLLMALLSWGLILLEYWLSLAFLGLSLTWPQLVTALTLNRLAFLAPLPGGLGALESGQVLAMTTLGLDPTLGVAQALLIRARDVAMGLLGLWWASHTALALSPKSDIRPPP